MNTSSHPSRTDATSPADQALADAYLAAMRELVNLIVDEFPDAVAVRITDASDGRGPRDVELAGVLLDTGRSDLELDRFAPLPDDAADRLEMLADAAADPIDVLAVDLHAWIGRTGAYDPTGHGWHQVSTLTAAAEMAGPDADRMHAELGRLVTARFPDAVALEVDDTTAASDRAPVWEASAVTHADGRVTMLTADAAWPELDREVTVLARACGNLPTRLTVAPEGPGVSSPAAGQDAPATQPEPAPDDASQIATVDELIAAVDAGLLGRPVAAALDRLRPRFGSVQISSAMLLGSLSAVDNLELELAATVADAGWRRGRDGIATVAQVWSAAGRQPAGNWQQVLSSKVPPLTGQARKRAATALQLLDPALTRSAACNVIDRRDGRRLDPDGREVLRGFATAAAASAAQVAPLCRALGATATLTGQQLAVATEAGSLTVTETDWSSAQSADGSVLTTGLRPAERDPLTVARRLCRAAGLPAVQ